jgi:myosin heavy subunit
MSEIRLLCMSNDLSFRCLALQVFSCEKWRLVRRSETEHAFHIFYKLVAGVDGALRKELALDQISSTEQNIFFTPVQKVNKKHYT